MDEVWGKWVFGAFECHYPVVQFTISFLSLAEGRRNVGIDELPLCNYDIFTPSTVRYIGIFILWLGWRTTDSCQVSLKIDLLLSHPNTSLFHGIVVMEPIGLPIYVRAMTLIISFVRLHPKLAHLLPHTKRKCSIHMNSCRNDKVYIFLGGDKSGEAFSICIGMIHIPCW